MIDRLAAALDAVRRLPPERQALAADILENLVSKEAAGFELSAEQIDEVRESLAEAQAGDFATDDEVAAVFAKLTK